MPTLNSAATLDGTLMSLTASPDIRVIVADSFSTDETPRICGRWNVEVISVPPGNMYQAINEGLRLATSEWLAYVNSDDWVFTGAYMKMLQEASARQASLAYGNTDYVDSGGRFVFSFRAAPAEAAPTILRSGIMPFSQPAAIYRRTVFQALNGFDERYRSASDFDFFCRAALMGFQFHRYQTQPVVAFRVQEGLGARHPEWNEEEKKLILERLQPSPGFAGRWARVLWSLSNTVPYFARVLRSPDLFGGFSFQRNSGLPPKSGE